MSPLQDSPFGASVSCPQCETELNELNGVWGVCPRCSNDSYWIGDPSLRNREPIGIIRCTPRFETPAPTSSTIALSPPAQTTPRRSRQPRHSASEAPTEETPGSTLSQVARQRQSERRLRTRRQMHRAREEHSVSESPEVADPQSLFQGQAGSQTHSSRHHSRRISAAIQAGTISTPRLRPSLNHRVGGNDEGEEVISESPEFGSTEALVGQQANLHPAGDDELYAQPSSTYAVTSSTDLRQSAGPVNELMGEVMDETLESSASDIPARAPPRHSISQQPRQAPHLADTPRGASSDTRRLLGHARRVHWILTEQTRMLNSAVRQLEQGVNDGMPEMHLLNRRRSVEGQLREARREARRVRQLIGEVAGSFLIKSGEEPSLEARDTNQVSRTQQDLKE